MKRLAKLGRSVFRPFSLRPHRIPNLETPQPLSASTLRPASVSESETTQPLNGSTPHQPGTDLDTDECSEKKLTEEGMTAKELKDKYRSQFQSDYERYYPVSTFRRLGFSRSQCPCCNKFYWSRAPRPNCGDSSCAGGYSFIGSGLRGSRSWDLTSVYKSFERSFTSSRIPSTPIRRYPVVARWRSDVDFVAAGIFCFQPHCVTGAAEPPANPLICPQFCVRFNDLDNIGWTGRHFSGFIMLGIQVFNYPGKYKFFKEECVEFNYDWLTRELGIPPEEITFIEDLWAGGGNLGPSVEYFVRGLELGNMVFMQFQTYPDGRLEELQTQVVDTGIGLERVLWALGGQTTSYVPVFGSALEFLAEKLGIEMESEEWRGFAPFAALLDADDASADCSGGVWEKAAAAINSKASAKGPHKPISPSSLRAALSPLRDAFVILDHTRTLLFLFRDGALPAGSGGGANLRQLLRRVFALLEGRGWWPRLGEEGLLRLFELHAADLGEIYAESDLPPSLAEILRLEVQRWRASEESQKARLAKLAARGRPASLEEWAVAVGSWGLPAESVARTLNQSPPERLFSHLAESRERKVEATPPPPSALASVPETRMLYLEATPAESFMRFEGRVLAQLPQGKEGSIGLVLDQTGFYPTSGGQLHDIGEMEIDGKSYDVIDVEKMGGCVVHWVALKPQPSNDSTPQQLNSDPSCSSPPLVGGLVSGRVDELRRSQLRQLHSGAHIIFSAARRILGPHIWQAGARKTPHRAHIDLTHFSSLSDQQEADIEAEANRIIQADLPVSATFQPRGSAETLHGFGLYQGGAVPLSSLRVVEIKGVDAQACCGTHVASTGQVGQLALLESKRIGDGVIRLVFEAGETSLARQKENRLEFAALRRLFAVDSASVLPTARRILEDYKRSKGKLLTTQNRLTKLESLLAEKGGLGQKVLYRSSDESPTIPFAAVGGLAPRLGSKGISIGYIGRDWLVLALSEEDGSVVGDIQKVVSAKVAVKDSVKFRGKAVKGLKIVSVVACREIGRAGEVLKGIGFVDPENID